MKTIKVENQINILEELEFQARTTKW